MNDEAVNWDERSLKTLGHLAFTNVRLAKNTLTLLVKEGSLENKDYQARLSYIFENAQGGMQNGIEKAAQEFGADDHVVNVISTGYAAYQERNNG